MFIGFLNGEEVKENENSFRESFHSHRVFYRMGWKKREMDIPRGQWCNTPARTHEYLKNTTLSRKYSFFFWLNWSGYSFEDYKIPNSEWDFFHAHFFLLLKWKMQNECFLSVGLKHPIICRISHVQQHISESVTSHQPWQNCHALPLRQLRVLTYLHCSFDDCLAPRWRGIQRNMPYFLRKMFPPNQRPSTLEEPFCFSW